MAEAPFYIASTGPSARPRRTLKHDDTFAVFDSQGDMGASAGGPDGLFDHDTRYLSRLELLIDGMQPLLLGSSVRDDNLTLTADLTNPDIFYDDHIALQRDALHIVRTAYLWNSTAHQRIAICNHNGATISFSLALTFGADFADLFEVRSHKRERRGHLQETVSSETDVALVYTGLDGQNGKQTFASDRRRPNCWRARPPISFGWKPARSYAFLCRSSASARSNSPDASAF